MSPPYPTATPADVLASWARYQASLSVALMDGVPAAVLIEHYGRTMAAVRFVLAAMADDAGRGP